MIKLYSISSLISLPYRAIFAFSPMQTKVTDINGCKQEVEFDISAEELKPHFEKAYLSYRNRATIPGFRKGKVPLSLIKRNFGDEVERSALESIAAEFFNEYLKERDLGVLGEGLITDLQYERGGELKFKISFETKPQIKLKNYKGISVTKPIYEVDEKMVDEEIKHQQAKHRSYKAADRAEDENYVVTVEMQKLDKTGFPLVGYNQDDVKFFLNHTHLSEHIREQLMNISPGETRTIKLENTDTGKSETYILKAKKVERIVHPDLDPEFFKKVTGKDIQNLDDFRKFIKDDLQRIYQLASEQELEKAIVSELIRSNDIPVPEILVEKVLNSRIEDIRRNSPKRELPEGFDIEEFRKSNRVDAILQVKWYLIKEKIIEMEKLEVSEEEIDKAAREYAERYNLPVDKVANSFRKNEYLRQDLLSSRVMQLLKSNALIKEIKQPIEWDSKIYV